jgi:hypothetical protein
LVPPSVESRAAAVDDYFARLDRAFATLQTAAPGSPPDAVTIDSAAHPPPMPPRSVEAGECDTTGAPSTQAKPPAAPHDVAGLPAPRDGMPIPERLSADQPTLGDAFAALLALEQGQPVPEGAGWASVVTADLVEQIARIVNREISERVVRDLAPGIITQVAERLVREELARITSSQRDR